MRRRIYAMSLVVVVAVLAVPAGGDEDKDKKDKDKIPGIGPAGKMVELHKGFKFTEGPAHDKDGNVYFSDIPNNKIHKVDLKGKLTLFRDKSNRANGTMFNGKGELVVCEMAGQVAAISADGKKRRVIADKYMGKRFNAP